MTRRLTTIFKGSIGKFFNAADCRFIVPATSLNVLDF
jgi:hypothetical protein